MSISVSKPMSKPDAAPARRIDLFTGAGRRRAWTSDEKAAIVAESYAGGASVCEIARRRGLTPTQLFTWRREARERAARDGEPAPLFGPAVSETVASREPVASLAPLVPSPADRRRQRMRSTCRRASSLASDRWTPCDAGKAVSLPSAARQCAVRKSSADCQRAMLSIS